MTEVPHSKAERSLGELFSELARETSELVRQEVTLAKKELSQKVSHIGKDIGFLAAGGAVAYAGLLAIVAAIIALLAESGMSLWASALIVGLVVLAIGGFLVWNGLNALKREELAPRETIQTLQEDKEWAKEQMT
jgi:hypothetical protein